MRRMSVFVGAVLAGLGARAGQLTVLPFAGDEPETRVIAQDVVVTGLPSAKGATMHRLMFTRKEKGDVAFSAEYAVYFEPARGALVWHHDLRVSKPLDRKAGRLRNTSRQQAGAGELSHWPFGAVTAADGKGTALALDPETPAVFQFYADGVIRRLVLRVDIALTDESPRAEVRLAEYAISGASPFRSALTGYYALYPMAFRSRTKRHGVWMPFSSISQVQGWEDFGFRFKEGDGEAAWDKAHGIETFVYTEPTTWWQAIPGPTNAYDLAGAAKLVAANKNPLAKAWEAGVFHDRDGKPVGFIKDTPWCKGVVWNFNDAPGIAGETTGWKVKMSAKPRCEYIDSAEMYVTVPLDFRRSHFAGMKTPLTWEPKTGRPAIFKGLIGYEYVKAAAEKAHANGFLTMANGTPTDWFWLAPNLDVLGTEWDWQDWRNGKRVWTPPSDEELMYKRALCGKKPFCFLMNTDFSLMTPERTRRYFDRCLAYGAFPGYFSIDAASAPYFTRPELYNRDRPMFKKYIPLARALSEAGWVPENTILSVSDRRVVAEQFGTRYTTLFNPLAEDMRLMVSFPKAKRVVERLSGREIANPAIPREIVLKAETLHIYDVE